MQSGLPCSIPLDSSQNMQILLLVDWSLIIDPKTLAQTWETISLRQKWKRTLQMDVHRSWHISQRDFIAFLILYLGVREIVSCLLPRHCINALDKIPRGMGHRNSIPPHRNREGIGDYNKQDRLKTWKCAPQQILIHGFSGNRPGPLKSAGVW